MGSERGLEYDTVSGKYAEFVEAEVLPKVEKNYGVKLTKDPDARMTLGGSSGGSASFTMAWFHPELVPPRADLLGHVRQPASGRRTTRAGAWEYHDHVIAAEPGQADPDLDARLAERQRRDRRLRPVSTTG